MWLSVVWSVASTVCFLGHLRVKLLSLVLKVKSLVLTLTFRVQVLVNVTEYCRAGIFLHDYCKRSIILSRNLICIAKSYNYRYVIITKFNKPVGAYLIIL